MAMQVLLIAGLAALALVAFLGWWRESLRRAAGEQAAARIPELEAQLRAAQDKVAAAQAQAAELRARLEESLRTAQEKEALLERARNQLTEAFQALSAEALRHNNASFLQLAQETFTRLQQAAQGDLASRQQAIDQLVAPMRQTLEQVNQKLQEMEVERARAFSSLSEHLHAIAAAHRELRGETEKLVRALRSPTARGRWGELQLRRTVELAGLVNYCDFVQQQTISGSEGFQRPDLIVRLPNNRLVVVDAKTPLSAYLEALETTDENVRLARLREHASQVRSHLQRLGAQSYWSQFECTPEFVVAFLPGEVFFSAALEQDPELIEYGALRRVIIATPTTLIALLKAVAYGWRQEEVARNAQEIARLGAELYERLLSLAGHFSKLGESLDRSVENYNRAIGSLESRVLVSARRMKERGIQAAAELEPLEPVNQQVRAPAINAPLASDDIEGAN